MEFENACSEMYYIIEHMNSTDKKKIPESTIQFFRDNRSIFYKVNLDVTKNLSEQTLKDETKAFIQILNETYFSNEAKVKNIQQCFEKIKNRTETNKTTALIITKKENKIILWLKKLFKINGRQN